MVDWEQISTVLLDMDGVLLDLRFDNRFWMHHVPTHYGRKHGVDTETARAHLYPRMRAVEGTLNWYCIDYWTQALEIDIVELKHAMAHEIKVKPGVVEFLQAIKQLHLDVRLVTNAHRKTIDIKLGKTGLGPYFDRIISSHDYAAPKEQLSFWQDMRTRYPFDSTHTLFIDDNLAVLQAARNFGIGHVVAVSWPDSSLPEREVGEFAAIRSLTEIMPA